MLEPRWRCEYCGRINQANQCVSCGASMPEEIFQRWQTPPPVVQIEVDPPHMKSGSIRFINATENTQSTPDFGQTYYTVAPLGPEVVELDRYLQTMTASMVEAYAKELDRRIVQSFVLPGTVMNP